MWTYASLEAESEGLVEHNRFPLFLSLHPSQYSPQSIFQCCSLVEKERKRWQEFPGDPQECCVVCGQRWTMCPSELGIETNIVCSYD